MSDESRVLLAMVALNSPDWPDPEEVIASFAQRCPDGPEVGDSDAKGTTAVYDFGEGKIAISLMPAPIPWEELEGPCETAWWWPEATETMQAHTHHLIVSLLGGEGTPAERHVQLTQFVASVLEHTDAAGVYWGAGTVVHEPSAFIEQADELEPDGAAPQLWVDMRMLPNPNGSFRYFTTGLGAFNQPELEIDFCEEDADDTYQFCYGIIHYLMTSGKTIADGETVGRSATEKVRVTHAPSMWQREGDVMKLHFE